MLITPVMIFYVMRRIMQTFILDFIILSVSLEEPVQSHVIKFHRTSVAYLWQAVLTFNDTRLVCLVYGVLISQIE